MPIEATIVQLEEEDQLGRETEPCPADRGTDVGCPREICFHVFAAMPVVAYPAVDTSTPLGTVGDGTPLWRDLGDRAERVPPDSEREVRRERTHEGSKGQFCGHILVHAVGELRS